MPCRSDYPETDRLSETRAHLDAVTAELCRTQRFVQMLHRTRSLHELGYADTQELNRIVNLYTEHREKDRERALLAVRNELKAERQKAHQITGLGGLPGPELKLKISSLEERERNIIACDPVLTTIF